jgi:transposase
LAKYTQQYKLEVVRQYTSGKAGYKAVAQSRGLDYSMVRRWVKLYEAHGEAGLEKKFSHYSAADKLAVLEHMWSNELSYTETAAAFNIRNPGCLPAWERWYHSGGIDALIPRPRGKPKKMSDSSSSKPIDPAHDETRTREEILAELNYLRMENAYLKKLEALVQAQRQQVPGARKKRK